MADTDFDPGRLHLFDRDHTLLPTGFVFKTWEHPGGVPVTDENLYADDDEILTVEVAGAMRGYPLQVIASHHIVQDRVGEREVLVTF